MSFSAGDRTGGTLVHSGHENLAQRPEPALTAQGVKKPRLIGKYTTIRQSAKRITKLTISLLYYVALALWRFVLRLTGRSPAAKLIILYYHGIPRRIPIEFCTPNGVDPTQGAGLTGIPPWEFVFG